MKYPSSVRGEIHSLIEEVNPRALLDVGCNDGSFGGWVAARLPQSRVVGLEQNADQADRARARLDRVVVGTFPEALAEVEETFDCITFNHVLEHMVDPWDALQRARKHLRTDGCVIAVLPNVRYISVVYSLVIRGRWDYADLGILDRTHLRFFTRKTALELFAGAGFIVDRLEPVNAVGSVRYPRLSKLLAAVFREFVVGAYVVCGRRRPGA